jgi:hypothetical protein
LLNEVSNLRPSEVSLPSIGVSCASAVASNALPPKFESRYLKVALAPLASTST